MIRSTHSKLNAQISEEASEWFVALRTGEVRAADRAEFDAWVRSSPEHLRAYLEIAAIWKCSESLRSSNSDWKENDVRAGTNVVELPSALLDPSGRAAVTCDKQRRRFSMAVCLVAILMVAGSFAWYQLSSGQVYETGVGEHRSVRLRDGSLVELNSRSRISVRFGEGERRVELLEGQALFQVSKDLLRPFIVLSDATRIRAVGTQFDVDRKRSATVVTVIEGTVAITRPVRPSSLTGLTRRLRGQPQPQTARSAPDSESTVRGTALFLVAGEQLTVTPQTTNRPVTTNVAVATAWTQGQIVLIARPLGEVAEEFNRYSERRLIVEDHGRSELRLSGVFSTEPTFLIRYLRARPDITVSETLAEIRIVRHN
jgi:transmembrane sensor